jgi:hypothetical protein
MSAIKYTFSIQDDFPNRKVASDRLSQEVCASAIVTALVRIDTSGDACDVWFKDVLSSENGGVLGGLIAVHSGEPLPEAVPQVSIAGVIPTAQGRVPTAAARPVAPKLTFISPNWCDKTTWHQNAAQVTDELATTADRTTYSVENVNLIDTYHGKVTFEDALDKHIVVKVNGTAKTEQDPHLGSGGDYTVDYAAGSVTFLTERQIGDAVTVSYWYARKATFILKPEAGKRLLIGTVEIQFSDDVVMNDTFVFQAYGLVDVFAPQLVPGIPSGTKIPIGAPLVYKTFNDLLNDSNGAYPGYPAFGGTNWRALRKQAFIFVWDYTVGQTALEAAYGMEIHLDLEHDSPCGGTFGTATFYCTSEAE